MKQKFGFFCGSVAHFKKFILNFFACCKHMHGARVCICVEGGGYSKPYCVEALDFYLKFSLQPSYNTCIWAHAYVYNEWSHDSQLANI